MFLVSANSVLGGFQHTQMGEKSILPGLRSYVCLGPTVMLFLAC